jgi:hypothetical protein
MTWQGKGRAGQQDRAGQGREAGHDMARQRQGRAAGHDMARQRQGRAAGQGRRAGPLGTSTRTRTVANVQLDGIN